MADEYLELAERARRAKKPGKDDPRPPSREPPAFKKPKDAEVVASSI
jgi:hypothetical protein